MDSSTHESFVATPQPAPYAALPGVLFISSIHVECLWCWLGTTSLHDGRTCYMLSLVPDAMMHACAGGGDDASEGKPADGKAKAGALANGILYGVINSIVGIPTMISFAAIVYQVRPCRLHAGR